MLCRNIRLRRKNLEGNLCEKKRKTNHALEELNDGAAAAFRGNQHPGREHLRRASKDYTYNILESHCFLAHFVKQELKIVFPSAQRNESLHSGYGAWHRREKGRLAQCQRHAHI